MKHLAIGARVMLGLTAASCLYWTSTGHSQQTAGRVDELTMAKELNLGTFCLTNVPSGSIKVLGTFVDTDRTWYRLGINVAGGAQGRARAFLFDKPLSRGAGFTSCASPGANVRTVLSGALNSASIQAYYSFATATQSAAWQVEKGELKAELGKVSAQFGTLFGGKVDPAQRLLWVNNPKKLLFANGGATKEGVIRIEMTDITLQGAKLMLAENYSPLTLDLKAISDVDREDKGHVSFDMDVLTGGIQLARGTLFAEGVTLPSGTIHASYGQVVVQSGGAQRVSLHGRESSVQLELSRIDAQIGEIRHTLFPVTTVVPLKGVTLKGISGKVMPSTDLALLTEPSFVGMSAPAVQIALGEHSERRALSGQAVLKVAALDDQVIEAELSLNAPVVRATDFVVGENGIDQLQLAIKGPRENSQISGHAIVSRLRAGSLRWSSPESGQRLAVSMSGGIHSALGVQLPFSLDLPTRSGSAHFALPDGRVALEGKLDRFKARGFLAIDLGQDVPVARLVVAPDSFSLGMSGQVIHEPLLFGAVPTLAAGMSLKMTAPGGFEVTSGRATGKVLVGVGAVIVNNSELAFADGTSGMRIGVPLRTSADTALGLDLHTMDVSFEAGTLEVEQLTAQSAGPQTVSIAGMQIASPRLSIDRLRVAATAGQARVEMRGMAFEATQVIHAADPYVTAELTQPLRIATAEAVLGSVRQSLRLVDGSLSDMTLHSTRTVFRSGDGLDVQGNSALIEVRKVSMNDIDASIAIADGEVQLDSKGSSSSTRLRTHFDGFLLDAQGTKGALNGQASLKLSDLSLGVKSRVRAGDCAEEQQWKIRSSVELGRVHVDMSMRDSKLHGELVVPSGRFNARNDGYSRCEFNKTHILVEEQRGRFEYPCFRGIKWYTCDGWTIIVPEVKAVIRWVAELHDLQVSGRIADTRISVRGERGLRVCPGRIDLNPPLVVANYHPNFKEGGFLQNLVRDLIRGMASVFESVIVNLVGTSVSAATHLRSALIPEQCYG